MRVHRHINPKGQFKHVDCPIMEQNIRTLQQNSIRTYHHIIYVFWGYLINVLWDFTSSVQLYCTYTVPTLAVEQKYSHQLLVYYIIKILAC